MASPRFNEAKYFIISHVVRSYTCMKNTEKFNFITILIMPRLSKHEKSGTIEMLQDGLRVTDIAQYYNCHPSTIQVLRDRYQATGMVKDRHRSVQLRITTRHPDVTLTAFFVLWHYPLYVKIKGEQTLETNMTMLQLILPASLSIIRQQI